MKQVEEYITTTNNAYVITLQRVGAVDAGEGADVYYEVISDGIMYASDMQDFLEETFCFDGGQGQSFCHSVTSIRNPYNECKFIAIVHNRLDV